MTFPLGIYEVHGKSMFPAFIPGQRVIITKWFWTIKVGSVVVCKYPRTKKLIIKRIAKINGHKVYLTGDNKLESIDSRDFGWLNKDCIVGKVFWPQN